MGLSSGPLTKTMYKELWLACAGPQVSIPCVGERVYYFPEGHMEQIKAYMHNGSQQQLPSFYLPPKILCKVVNVQLLVEPDTDEIYADITLLPDHDQGEVIIPDPPLLESSTCMVRTICKTLTTLDTSTIGGLSLPLRDAVDCLLTLDMSQQPSWQEVVASDLQNNEWHFCHMLQEHPKRHFLTTGWSDFVNAKKLVAGDAFLFLRGGNGEICVGVRRRKNHTSSATSNETHLSILATTSHAITSGTRFLVTYRPRASPSPFIISLNKYLKAQSYRFSVGMKFQLKFDGVDSLEQRFRGTIVGVGETASSKWPDSEWRSLKVRWDQGMLVSCPNRVSAWEIDPPKRSWWSCCCFGISIVKKLFCLD
uniref:auxin response factor 1-like n=1 Tax=Erigeron canadensis TaxID=72917 RepID=UPI001CB92256|nr:auxin response factor 1-like [Erigeron canadensis]XP_043621682.1 auxin response factor 1-like [Erigeron canadensis]